MWLRQRRNPMTDGQPNEGVREGENSWANSRRRGQSELHALRAEGEINSYSCPTCGSQNTQRLSTAYMSGLSQFSAVTSGIGWARAPMIGRGWTSGTSQTQLSAISAPPPKKSYRNGLLLLFLSPLLAAIVAEAVFLIVQRMFGASLIYEQLATISFFGLEIVAITVLLRVFAFNKNIWPRLLREWQMSFLCRRCGQVFVQASVP